MYEIKAFRITVQINQEMAGLICISYYLDANNTQLCMDFFELATTFADLPQIPNDRPMTFKGTIRSFGRATVVQIVADNYRSTAISSVITEAYDTTNINIEEVNFTAPV